MAKPKLEVVNEFKVEAGVPVISRTPRRKYPFNEMEVGDSFDIGTADWKIVGNAAWAFGRVNSKKFSVRKHGGGHRCWRVA